MLLFPAGSLFGSDFTPNRAAWPSRQATEVPATTRAGPLRPLAIILSRWARRPCMHFSRYTSGRSRSGSWVSKSRSRSGSGSKLGLRRSYRGGFLGGSVWMMRPPVLPWFEVIARRMNMVALQCGNAVNGDYLFIGFATFSSRHAVAPHGIFGRTQGRLATPRARSFNRNAEQQILAALVPPVGHFTNRSVRTRS